MITVRKPTGKDLVDLFLLCAPKDILEELEITEENRNDAADSFGEYESFSFHEMFGFALFFASKSMVNQKKSAPLLQQLYIDPASLFSLITSSTINECTNVTVDYEAIERAIRAKGGNQTAKRSPIAGAKKYAQSTWNNWEKNHELFKSKAALARHVLKKFTDIKTSEKDIAKWCGKWEKAMNLPQYWWRK